MKIGILTFHASHNCGSMLQAFALQYVLEHKFGANVEIIDFSNWGSRNMYGMIDFRISKNAIKHNFNNLKNYHIIKNVRNDYIEFSNTYLHKTQKKYNTINDLKEIENNYDILISGGDQVWNIKCQDADDAYFLPFAKNVKKVAYSPSFGAMNLSIHAKNPDKYKNYLLDYDYLSIREFNGQKWLKNLLNQDVPVIPDPTLLLSKDEWSNIFNLEIIKEDYIFNYAFSYNNDDNNKRLKEISETTNMPIYIMDAKSYTMHNLGKKYGFILYPESGPLAFLKLMFSTKLAITQSFHGALFAALFNKTFWPYKNKIIRNPNDDRAISLMKQLGLEERYKTLDEINMNDMLTPIDYQDVNNRIQQLSINGYNYIKKFLA